MAGLNYWEVHLDEFVREYSENFYWKKESFLGSKEIAILLEEARRLESLELLRPAQIGKAEIKKVIPEVRSDQISWLENFDSIAGKIVSDVFSGLQLIARRELYLPARRFECHFAKYEIGSEYKLHRDRHSIKPGRLVTCVLYLTDCESDSGNLILYDQDLRQVKIQPKAGSIVVFDSALEHRVSMAKQDRWSVTGWIREDFNPGIRL